MNPVKNVAENLRSYDPCGAMKPRAANTHELKNYDEFATISDDGCARGATQ
jgi:hypothetical protein